MELLVRSVRWDITNKCNLQCLHCYTTTKLGPELHYSEILQIIQKLLPLGLREINFSGREPTLRKDLPQIVDWCCRNNLIVNITTNGTALSKKGYEILLDSGLNMVVFSLDGSSERTHDKIRGNGTFQKTISNIKNCVNYITKNNLDTKISISCTLQKFNAQELPYIIDLCHSIGINFLGINPVSFCGAASTAKQFLYLSPEQVLTCWEEICKEYARVRPNYELYLGTFPTEAKFLNTKYKLNLPVIQTGCSAGRTIYINPEGEALPCYMIPPIADEMPELKRYLRYWKILSESISRASELFEPFISFTNTYSQKNNTGCVDCSDVEVCKRCPLIAISDPDAILRCQIAKSKLNAIKIDLTPEVKPIVKSYVSWRIEKNTLLLSVHNGDYRSEKEFELNSFAKSIWFYINNQISIGKIEDRLKKEWPGLSVGKIHQNLFDFISYFHKEGVIEI